MSLTIGDRLTVSVCLPITNQKQRRHAMANNILEVGAMSIQRAVDRLVVIQQENRQTVDCAVFDIAGRNVTPFAPGPFNLLNARYNARYNGCLAELLKNRIRVETFKVEARTTTSRLLRAHTSRNGLRLRRRGRRRRGGDITFAVRRGNFLGAH